MTTCLRPLSVAVAIFLTLSCIHIQPAVSETITERVPVVFDGEEVRVVDVLIDDEDCVYVRLGRNGVLRKCAGSDEWEQVIESYSHGISLDAEGVLWSVRSENLTRFKDGIVTHFFNDRLNIYSVAALPGNVVWGVGAGVLRYDIGAGIIKQYGLEHGVSSLMGKWVVASSDSNVWVSHTDRYYCGNCQYDGVSHFDGTDWEVFTVENGLLDKEVAAIVAFSPSEVYIGGPGGIAKYDGDSLVPFNTEYHVSSLTEGPDGALWASGYKEYPFKVQVHVKFDGDNIYEYACNGHTGFFMDMDSLGNIWEIAGGELYKHTVSDPVLVETQPEAQPIVLSNYPNPFNPVTTIEFSLDGDSFVTLDIYNVAGQHVNALQSGRFAAGTHSVVWNGADDAGAAASSGVYFCRLRAGGRTAVHRMVLMR